jgi:hypothetical protein
MNEKKLENMQEFSQFRKYFETEMDDLLITSKSVTDLPGIFGHSKNDRTAHDFHDREKSTSYSRYGTNQGNSTDRDRYKNYQQRRSRLNKVSEEEEVDQQDTSSEDMYDNRDDDNPEEENPDADDSSQQDDDLIDQDQRDDDNALSAFARKLERTMFC